MISSAGCPVVYSVSCGLMAGRANIQLGRLWFTLRLLLAYATKLGIDVQHVVGGGPVCGEPERVGVVVVNDSAPLPDRRACLARQIAHWRYGHDRTREDARAGQDELASDAAARLLVPREQLRDALTRHAGDVSAAAEDLGVPVDLVERRLAAVRRALAVCA